MRRILAAVIFALLFVAADVGTAKRLPTISPNQYTEEQKRAAAAFEAARHTPVFGPFEPMMYSPRLMSAARTMGDYLRYKSAIGNRLSELVILLTARAWTQDYEWSVHYPIALKVGIQQEVVDAIAEGRHPAMMNPDEKLVFDYVTELLRTHQVSDQTFDRARSRFGAKGVVDMTGITGYYTLLAMQLNTARYPSAKGGVKLPKLVR